MRGSIATQLVVLSGACVVSEDTWSPPPNTVHLGAAEDRLDLVASAETLPAHVEVRMRIEEDAPHLDLDAELRVAVHAHLDAPLVAELTDVEACEVVDSVDLRLTSGEQVRFDLPFHGDPLLRLWTLRLFTPAGFPAPVDVEVVQFAEAAIGLEDDEEAPDIGLTVALVPLSTAPACD